MRFILLVSLIFLVGLSESVAQWRQQEFVIGTFGDPNLSDNNSPQGDRASFSKARQAGFNLLTGYQLRVKGTDRELMQRYLQAASASGLKILITDKAMELHNDAVSEVAVRSLLNYYQQLPLNYQRVILGYNVGDEPEMRHVPIMQQLIKLVKAQTGKLAYVNLLPEYGFPTRAAYEAYLRKILVNQSRTVTPDVVSFDYYPFLGKEGSLRPGYFYNLSIVKSLAGGRPVWTYVLTTQHAGYAFPDEYQINFMTFCPIAYGVKGIIYFTYETVKDNFNAALISKFNETTERLPIAARNNKYIGNVLGPIVMNNTCVATYCYDNHVALPEAARLNAQSPYILSIGSQELVTGVFKAQKNEYYAIFVNKAKTPLKGVHVKLRSLSAQHSVYKNSLTQPSWTKITGVSRTTTDQEIVLDFAPGEPIAVAMKTTAP
ncbi:hypothetical protein ACTJJB_17180 [Chitinophaga sp. 22536]|uniref:hypothetical protein n=1 Tax=unclassified Chitinophaga TaxID=2619133 RepID=UPI003F83E74B